VSPRTVVSPVSPAVEPAAPLPPLLPAPPPPPPPQAAPPAPIARASAADTQLAKLPSAREPAPTASADQGSADNIVVTGSRVSRSNLTSNTPTIVATRSATRVAQACTIEDANEDLRACTRIADPAAAGAKGRAATALADGLTRAWAGDTDGAIAAFDRAIGQSPLAIAYLNRGLAWQRKGDMARARADFDRAIKRSPGDARGYYWRSRWFDAQGDSDHAERDADKAVKLDPSYEALLQ
jgi:tetratricopeptide (TPR) repeat protein